jgi:hypothetical protein
MPLGSIAQAYQSKTGLCSTMLRSTTAFSLLVCTKQPLPTRLFLKKRRTSPKPPVQSRSENALEQELQAKLKDPR